MPKFKFFRILRNLEAGAGGGGSSAPANPFSDGGSAPPAGSPPAGATPSGGTPPPAGATPPGGSQPYYPQGLPDHLRGANERETLDKVFTTYSGLRDELAKRGSVPKAPDGYQLKLSEAAAKVYGDVANDRGAKIFQTLAHKHGLTDKQAAGLFAEFHDEGLSQGLVKTVDINAEISTILGDQAKTMAPAMAKIEAGKRWQGVQDWIGVAEASKALAPEEAKALRSIAETGWGVRALEAMQKMTREHGLQPGGQGGGGAMTKADLEARANDPRNDPRHPQYTKEFAEGTKKAYQDFYGSHARG